MNVQFEEEKLGSPSYGFEEDPGGMSGMLVRWGWTKDQKGANMILLITMIVVIILTIFVFLFSGSSGTQDDTAPEDNPDLVRL